MLSLSILFLLIVKILFKFLYTCHLSKMMHGEKGSFLTSPGLLAEDPVTKAGIADVLDASLRGLGNLRK